MVDIIVKRMSYNQYDIYEIINGKEQFKIGIETTYFDDVIDRINEEYDYARILCGKNL